jgi:hypothetical protein
MGLGAGLLGGVGSVCPKSRARKPLTWALGLAQELSGPRVAAIAGLHPAQAADFDALEQRKILLGQRFVGHVKIRRIPAQSRDCWPDFQKCQCAAISG